MGYPNSDEFNKVYMEVKGGQGLTFSHIGRVFGQDFWELLVMCMMDANDAARAIQMSMLRMRAAAEEEARKIAADEATKMKDELNTPRIEIATS